MAITRRQFITRTGLTAGTVLGTGVFGHPLVRRAMAATSNKYTIVLFLDGGNDGLNTISPIDNGSGTLRTDYQAARRTGGGGIRLNPPANGGDLTNLLPIGTDPNTGAQIGMHPGFRGILDGVQGPGDPGFGGLYQLFLDGHVAVVQGCGYPDYNLSHEESRKIWQTANPLYSGAIAGTGWVGRFLAHPSQGYTGSDIPAINIQDSIAAEFRQFTTSVVAATRLEDFTFPIDDPFADDEQAKRDAFTALYGFASGSGALKLKLIGDSGTATYDSTTLFPTANTAYENERPAFYRNGYDQIDRSVARDLREIAKVIYAQEKGTPISGIMARYFQLSNGGYDTHSDQGSNQTDGQHFGLHAEVGASLKHFFDDLGNIDAGLPARTVVLIYSEFSRRIEQNDNGTDHGSQGPMFVIGGKVRGGIYGQHPNIGDTDDQGNTKYLQSGPGDPYLVDYRSTDFRDVYGTILTKWLGMDPPVVSADILPIDSGSASDFWTFANFDLKRSDGGTLFLP
ncbi:MAG TPA: DUF1501 domain-containing protein [Candidatus Binatia bacterium]|nr:DUF1501 domain-containing protein [Candidatus Binatia bacterium]